ncbi:MAG TPA: carbohydrate kinase family protein [Candidatus Acidoferrum sp.]|jgi:sugar/nucleoside kinase (ribokinase family)
MSATQAPQILVAGDLFLDLVMSGFPAWPPAVGEELFADSLFREAGGGAAITACGLAKLGTAVGVAGAVGDDGQWLIDRLARCGVSTSAIQRSLREPTAVTVSISSAADRTFLTYMGANRELPDLLQKLPERTEFSQLKHVHVACAPPPAALPDLLRKFSAHGASLSMDVGWHPEWLSDSRSRDSLRMLDIFFPNEKEAALMTGESQPQKILEVFQTMQLERVALKLGKKGAALLHHGEIIFCEPASVQSVDTTGAGDCFDAGFLFAWLRGDTPQACLRAGTICGALSTRAPGGIDGFPTLAELEAQP